MLEDSSFAIQPSQSKIFAKSTFFDIGNVVSSQKSGPEVILQTETGKVIIKFIREDIVQITANPLGDSCFVSSPAVVAESQPIDIKYREETDSIYCHSLKLILAITKCPLRITILDAKGNVIVSEGQKGMGYGSSKEVICFKEMSETDYFYGFGEKAGYLNKRGEKLTMWNTDVYAPHNPETDPLYQSIPFFITLRDGKAHGVFFDHTFRSTFDLQSEEKYYSFSADGGLLNYYVMVGPSPRDVLEQYTFLTGRMPIPPKWAIGYHQSRYSYETEEEVLTLAETFIKKEIPLDAIYLDIHYMDGYRVFTFDKNKFPNPEKMVTELKKLGIRIVPIVDPGVKQDVEYPIYKEGIQQDYFCKYIEGPVYIGDVWAGRSVFPDFTKKSVKEWWGTKHKYYTDLGIEGIWNDMNEPAVFNESKTMDLSVMHHNNGNPKSHRELHNLYGLLMSEATYEGLKKELNGLRPFVLTRAGYSGIQRYAAVWTGDNRSFWEHLQMTLPMIMNLGLSGVAFSGADVGGFAHNSNGELLTRWTQVGAFTPYFRNHSVLESVRQEPWSFGEKYEEIMKRYIELRYEWLPQLYTLFVESNRTGAPIMRPLFFEYPSDEQTYQISDQFMFGDNVIIAPIMEPGKTHRTVFLPEGRWVDYWTEEDYDGKQYHLVKAELNTLPIFVKKGSMILHGQKKLSTNIKDEKLFLHFYYEPNSTSSFTLYDDDGMTFSYLDGVYFKQTFEVKTTLGKIEIYTKTEGSYQPEWSEIEFVIHGSQKDFDLYLNGSQLDIIKEQDRVTALIYH